MFSPGFTFVVSAAPLVVSVHEIGTLHLPSGRLVSGDPVGAFEFEPFDRQTPVGAFPVQASLVSISPTESRIAAVRIMFSQQPIARWEVATGGTATESRGASGLPGYEGPLGMFLDRDTVPALEAYIDKNGPEWFTSPSRAEGRLWEYACFQPDPGRYETCVLFQAGRGEGVFTSYWAFGANDEPSMLVTDFNVIP